jgi:diguanylate cyclase (GGDEF)-like protein
MRRYRPDRDLIGGKNRQQRKVRDDRSVAADRRASVPEIVASVEDLKTNWFWSTDSEGRVSYLSGWIADELAAHAGELTGRDLTELLRAEDLLDASTSIGFLVARRKAFRGINVRFPFDVEERIWTVSGSPQIDEAGNFAGFRGVAADVTAVQESANQIARLAGRDPLTGLRNRRGMNTVVEQALMAAARDETGFSILLIDLDRFKQVNDTLGHPAGDQLLIQVADRLRREVSDIDRAGRIGGDEFQIVLTDTVDADVLERLAASIIEGLSQPYTVNGSRCVIGASIGIVICEAADGTPGDLARNADLALYAAKNAGKGCFRFFISDMLEAAEDRRMLEQDLLDALERGELEVNYQPLVAAKTNQVAGFEALLRWNHPNRGRISPALFIPIAEETNLIARLGEWVMRQACVDAAGWPGDLRVAVNVSPIQFANPNLPQIVVNALGHSGLRPDRLELEITESVFLESGASADAMFDTLKKIGVRLALDDFGTGYFSLGYLKSAPFDKIKIDQSFVRGAGDPKSRNRAIITSIVALADALGMDTTAEGVETVDQLEAMRELGVGLIQGYLYSLPVAAEAVTKNVGDGRWEIKPIGPAKQREHRLATFRRIGAVHGDHYYPVILRNLSSTGGLIQGIVGVPEGTRFVIDFGDRYWSVATVKRSHNDHQGIEFDDALVSDGQGGFRPRYRVSASMLTQIGVMIDKSMPTYQGARAGLPTFQTSLA